MSRVYILGIDCLLTKGMARPDLRTERRHATRRAISHAADRLFLEKGFDNVTVDEIAAAAGVGRMSVFNHFPRKEDMFFDRDEEGRETLRSALRDRDPDMSAVETLRQLAHRLVEEAPYLGFSAGSRDFMNTVAGSETLRARARAIRDELAEVVAVALAKGAGREPDDPETRLAASLVLATASTAFNEAHAAFRRTGDAGQAKALFLNLVDRGASGLHAALRETPYVIGSIRTTNGAEDA